MGGGPDFLFSALALQKICVCVIGENEGPLSKVGFGEGSYSAA